MEALLMWIVGTIDSYGWIAAVGWLIVASIVMYSIAGLFGLAGVYAQWYTGGFDKNRHPT